MGGKEGGLPVWRPCLCSRGACMPAPARPSEAAMWGTGFCCRRAARSWRRRFRRCGVPLAGIQLPGRWRRTTASVLTSPHTCTLVGTTPPAGNGGLPAPPEGGGGADDARPDQEVHRWVDASGWVSPRRPCAVGVRAAWPAQWEATLLGSGAPPLLLLSLLGCLPPLRRGGAGGAGRELHGGGWGVCKSH